MAISKSIKLDEKYLSAHEVNSIFAFEIKTTALKSIYMTSTDQIKDLKVRLDALRRYL